jgi:Protein of unknown function (DUF5818)
MKKQIAIVIASAAMMFASPASQTFTGTITEDMCKADHKSMNMGPDAKCVTECVKGMGAKFVLYDGKDAWVLSDQKTPAKFAAKKVTVTGTLDEKAKTIKVEKIEAAK